MSYSEPFSGTHRDLPLEGKPMQLPPFLLEHWLERFQNATPPVRYDLGASTGPPWTLRELLALDDEFAAALGTTRLAYAPARGSASLREAIAAESGTDPESVLVTTGASEAVSILLCLAAGPTRNVVLPKTAFPAFAAVAGAWGLAVRTYELSRDEGFEFSPDAVLAAVDDDTALVLMNTPHNPTGAVAPRAAVERLAAELAVRRIPLVVDEVYHPLYFGAPVPSAASIRNVIVVSDLSKALSLPGLRIGWIIDADAKRRANAFEARSYFTISGSPVTEALATSALRHGAAILARSARVTTANRAVLIQFMEEHRDALAWVPPQGGTVAFPWFVDGRDSRTYCMRLAEKGVLVVPGDCFGAPEHLRVGFGATPEGFAKALDIMASELAAG
jgi:aspartate/methionine/tyrosine aminotransferase